MPTPSPPTTGPAPAAREFVPGVQYPSTVAPRWEWEATALRAALDSCLRRNAGETAEGFLVRVSDQFDEWTRSPRPAASGMDRARAFVDCIVQTQLELPDADLARASSEIKDRVSALGREMGLPPRSDETPFQYAVRLRDVLAAAEPRRETLPHPESGEIASGAEPPPEVLDAELERMVKDVIDTTAPATPPPEKEKKKGGAVKRGG